VITLSGLLCLALAVAQAPGQSPALGPATAPPPPAPERIDLDASAELAAIVAAYRAAPSLVIAESVTVVASPRQGGEGGEAKPVAIEIDSLGGRRAAVRFRGFDCRMSEGTVSVIHESNPDAYVETEDGGSPYYTLFAAFIELPFPSLAIVLGEDAADEVAMQLHPRTPWVKPVRVERIFDSGGRERHRLVLEAEHERLTLDYDPATRFLLAAEATVTGGDAVPDGGTLSMRHEIKTAVPAEPFDAARVRLEPGDRARLDSIGALPKGPPPGADAPAAEIGTPAPELRLPSIAGGEVDLEDHLGRVVVLDFWASWCGPCREGLPKVAKFAADAKRRELPVVVLPVNVMEEAAGAARRDLVLESYRRMGLDPAAFPSLVDERGLATAAFRLRAIPVTVIVRADGTVHAWQVGSRPDLAEWLEGEVAAAIAAVEAPAAGPGAKSVRPSDSIPTAEPIP
jgi:thiol-disulfide isomerase/thioredoxin